MGEGTETIRDIVLIGPMQTGKSTLGKLLAEKLGVRPAPLDPIAWKYYILAGFEPDKARHLKETEGELSSYRYFEQFLLPALESHLRESRGCVIDLGAGHTVYWDDNLFARAKAILAPYPNLVLILPSPDLEESSTILRERTSKIAWLNKIREESGLDLNEQFLRHHSNFDLAKFTFYTKGRSPEQTADEILENLATATRFDVSPPA
jgi:shikimate kinase